MGALKRLKQWLKTAEFATKEGQPRKGAKSE